MNGGADLGGMMGFGPIVPEENEPNFHADWEARVMGMVVALGAAGQWNLDQSRFARESLPPAEYISDSYYEIWLKAATKLMLERGMITEGELANGHAITDPVPVKRTLWSTDVPSALAKGGPVDRPAETQPAFAPGDRVHTINIHPDSHTRLPRYARDKLGVIERVHGHHVFPDTNARGEGEQPTWLYKVSFEACTLWGERAAPGDKVTLDLWEPYLKGLK
ncbi:nitrile hydratase subunit beta [Gymnodinialimonas hymeniacidonis]|uniref:nitrile hydratase subunit beta n=1 Tax=Gymnodinialimonas hymeniacidonis TaxID=3126508 RepID=UPI0034C5E4B2